MTAAATIGPSPLAARIGMQPDPIEHQDVAGPRALVVVGPGERKRLAAAAGVVDPCPRRRVGEVADVVAGFEVEDEYVGIDDLGGLDVGGSRVDDHDHLPPFNVAVGCADGER